MKNRSSEKKMRRLVWKSRDKKKREKATTEDATAGDGAATNKPKKQRTSKFVYDELQILYQMAAVCVYKYGDRARKTDNPVTSAAQSIADFRDADPDALVETVVKWYKNLKGKQARNFAKKMQAQGVDLKAAKTTIAQATTEYLLSQL